ncbi:DUF1330 domain-containing protein [Antrihabitans cavernicola]|uniref:DUF1330 domain-containing protein n=1 Tax=Antrihabitans cavernicola TaxID=2495913 RepID=A0A5A7SGV8_9NOCA|nr:DUF1330 domain-containing protein [Spelaeibacter cavernicola]KAA0023893.1 DUF1330 domain-containing protein [Spelaeibacter cavernicola]
MTAYAVASLTNVDIGAGVVEYLERIDATLAPFGGKFIVHGSEQTMLEGEWPGSLIVIEFPDRAAVGGWYRSEKYQQILRLRTDNAAGIAMIVDGVDADHKATDVLAH